MLKAIDTEEDPIIATTLLGYLMFSRGIGNIVSAPISAKLYMQPIWRSSVERLGFDVASGRFETMIIYVGTCFAGAAGVAALGWGLESRKVRRGDEGN